MQNNNQSMYKIYSRCRMNFIKPKYGSPNKNLKLKYLVLIIAIAILIYIIIFKSINPIFQNLCEDEAKSIATKISSEEATRAVRGYSYEDLFTIERDTDGNIQMINANILTINEITSNVSKYIQEAIDNTETSKINIPLGSFTGIKLFSGEGPNIQIDISSAGNVDTELRSEFIAKGINQTLHRIYLQIDCEVSILIPFETIKQEISSQVLLIENVIIGRIPENYYNFEGIEDSSEVLEVIE